MKMLLLVIGMISNISFAKPQIIDKIAVIVNNGIILNSEISDFMKLAKLNAIQTNQQLQEETVFRHQIMERLILDQIVLQLGKKIGAEITNEQLDQEIADIASRHLITTTQMKKQLANAGISYEIFRNRIQKELLISKVVSNVVLQRISISPKDIDSLIKELDDVNEINDEINLSYISIPIPKNSTPEQLIKAKNQAYFIANEARNGADFIKLSIIYSFNQKIQDHEKVYWKRIQEMPASLANALYAAKKGDIIGPVRSGIFFYILKVNDLRKKRKNIFVIEINARHILLQSSPIMSDDEANEKLQKILDDIKSGRISFSDAAKKFSQDRSSANQGGDLGWMPITDVYDLRFRNALIKLRKGEISGPIHSSFGWHLIELLDIRNVDRTESAKKERAYQILFSQKFSEEVDKWLKEQRASAYVKILD